MSFTTTKDSIFYTLFITLNEIDYESCIFKISPENIYIQATDIAKISILDMTINKEYFEEYNIEDTYIIDFDINIINKICKILNKKYCIQFSIIDNYLYIETLRNTTDDIIKKFRINTNIVKNYDFIDINKLTYNNSYIIDSKLLTNIFNEIFVFSDDINFTINNKNICFSAAHDMGDIQYYYNHDNDSDCDSDSDIDINVAFKLKYLVKFKLSQLFENITIKVNNDKPILLKLKDANININYIIAPNYI